ncbi:MAG: molybdate ABC transporter substrate-binding protein [Candidatus Promineifilaceae bacterium]|nr:molybdate ABC transporter substrate-binding protein [Candidatus Promineifilaceae bacterium]
MTRQRTIWLVLILLLLLPLFFIVGGALLAGDGRNGRSGEGALTVFAAASLSDAFEAMGRQFEAAHPDVRVTFNFAGSQQLAQQLAQGAPGDVFASANVQQMAAVVESGRIEADAVETFAYNRLVVALPPDNPAGLSRLSDLTRPGVRLALADEAVPAGRYALTFLERAAEAPELGADFEERALANVVSYEQNVRTVLTKVALGEADAGIVYASDAAAAEVETIEIPEGLNPRASYPMAPLEDAERPALAEAFVNFVLSDRGQQTMAEFGFIPAGAPGAREAAPEEASP